jgi:hypothetical protein
VIAWAWIVLLAAVWTRGGPLLLDLTVRDTMAALRNPLADRLMAAFDTIGDAVVLGPAVAVGVAVAAVAPPLDRRGCIGGRLRLRLRADRRPGGVACPATMSFGVPSREVTLATITFGFFAGADRARTAGPRSRMGPIWSAAPS